jgi:glycosyltransferase involved in cell wall biosynthesis
MSKLSVIIPSYNCKYVSKTVFDVLSHAKEDVEVIVLLDGYVPDPPIPEDKRVIVIPKKATTGMRNSINLGVSVANGEFIMKLDDHCAISDGFDIALKLHSQPNQISIPSRYMLDAEKWKIISWRVEYEYMTYPYVYLDKWRWGMGLTAKKWYGENGIAPIENINNRNKYKLERHRKEIKIDEIMIFKGACWFMPRQHFISIGGLDDRLFKTMYQEPQELTFKTYLSGGKVIVNKHCWFAHLYKDSTTRGYSADLTAMRKTERIGTWYWMNDQWPGAKYKMKWLIEKFWPIPGWPDDWEEQKIKFEKKYPINGIEDAVISTYQEVYNG